MTTVDIRRYILNPQSKMLKLRVDLSIYFCFEVEDLLELNDATVTTLFQKKMADTDILPRWEVRVIKI